MKSKKLHASLIYNEEIEQALLGACMVQPEVLGLCCERLSEDHFRAPGMARMWEIMREMFLHNKAVTPDLLASRYKDEETRKVVQMIGEYGAIPRQEEVDGFIEVLDNLLKRRNLAWKTDLLLEELEADDCDASKVAEELEAFLFTLNEKGASAGPSLEGRRLALKSIEAACKNQGVVGTPTGFAALDRLVGGFGESDLFVLAGRPGMGKTALAICLAEHAAKAAPVLFCSLEMSKEQIEFRRLAIASGVGVSDMRSGSLVEQQRQRLFSHVDPGQLWIDDTPALSAAQLLARARRMKRKHGLGLIVVDYLQLMSAGKDARRQGTVAATTEISNSLKAIAKELGLPVLALSQLSRKVEERQDKRPQLQDLRESGAIEQDADVVMFAFREEYYLEREAPSQWEKETAQNFEKRMQYYEERLSASRGKAEIIIAKNRHGAIGSCQLEFEARTTRFYEPN